MIEKAGQAIKIVQTIFPLLRRGLHAITLLRHGRAFLVAHSSKYRFKMLRKQDGKRQKKMRNQLKRRHRQEDVSLLFKQEKLLFKMAILLRKQYF